MFDTCDFRWALQILDTFRTRRLVIASPREFEIRGQQLLDLEILGRDAQAATAQR